MLAAGQVARSPAPQAATRAARRIIGR
jgi:hypothetical protein